MIASAWKLTYDPAVAAAVILAIGDIIDDEITWSASRDHSVTPLVRAAAPFIFDGGNNVINATFSRHILAASTHAAGRQALLDSLVTFSTRAKKPIRIEADGVAGYWQAAHGIITAGTAKLSTLGTGRWVQSVEITMTGITYTAP